MKYLVVDDEAAICQGTVQRLRRFLPPEDAVECAFCGEDAIRQIAGSPPDVLITDIRMGAMDGLDLIEAARRANVDYAVDVYPFYGSDVEATLSAGNDLRHGLIGAGVYASHGYERSHRDGVENTFRLLCAYLG